uniref:Putative membrane protein n=1 Tax=Rhizobium rhizogenes TaxID=359 RepID=A0A7S5DQZ1_RHIRH|nr:putative membrane protein [Rhizobium rhizogenes]
MKQALIPLVILLCSIAAFYICLAHMSGQPGYSARNNLSSPTSIE